MYGCRWTNLCTELVDGGSKLFNLVLKEGVVRFRRKPDIHNLPSDMLNGFSESLEERTPVVITTNRTISCPFAECISRMNTYKSSSSAACSTNLSRTTNKSDFSCLYDNVSSAYKQRMDVRHLRIHLAFEDVPITLQCRQHQRIKLIVLLSYAKQVVQHRARF